MSDVLVYLAAASAAAAIWMLGLTRLDVFTPDDVRAFRRIAALRGLARPPSRVHRAIARAPLLSRLQRELELDHLLAVAGRSQTPMQFLGRALALSLSAFASLLGVDAVARASNGDWLVSPWIAPLAAALVFLVALARLRSQARMVQRAMERTVEDSLMPLAILSDSRGLQVHDALRLLSRCARDESLERLLDRSGWLRLVPRRPSSTRELYALVGDAYGVPALRRVGEAQDAVHVGVPEREVYTRLAESAYRDRLALARSQAARAKVLVTLPVAAMLIPLLLLLGIPTLQAITTGLQGG